MTGVVFDIREFTVHDGPGCRVTVFMKGCPLRCQWCHNPEGLSPKPQLMKKVAQCVSCGRCKISCDHPECAQFGVCVHACPKGLLSVSGKEWSAEVLAAHLNQYEPLLKNGGITFSGGEPLLQGEFVAETARMLKLHRALQTSGYAPEQIFRTVLSEMDYVLMDIKLADPVLHRQYTGVDNVPILRNYEILLASGIEHTIRVPLIPGVTDTEKNLRAIAQLTRNSKVELMRYNPLAGAKYPMLGMEFSFQEQPASQVDLEWFENASFC